MSHLYYNIIIVKVTDYVKENWGLPFIVGFMALLLSAAVSLATGLSYWADLFSLYAYYALAIGVLLQLACLFKNRKKDKEALT